GPRRCAAAASLCRRHLGTRGCRHLDRSGRGDLAASLIDRSLTREGLPLSSGPIILETPRPRHRRSLFRGMSGLVVLVAVVAGLLGAWKEYRRRSAVSTLIGKLSVGIPVSYVGDGDRTHPAFRGQFLALVGRIRALHAESLAVPALVEALRDAQTKH